LTGALWLFLVAFTAITWRIVVHDVQMARKLWWEGKVFRSLRSYFDVALALLILLILPAVFGGVDGPISWPRTVGTAAILVWTVFCLSPSGEVAGELAAWLKRADAVHPLRPYVNVFQILFEVLLTMGSIALYAVVAQPGFTQSLGGSRPSPVLLVPTRQTETFAMLGLPSGKDGLIGPVNLVHEDDDSYFVLTGTGESERVLRIPKSAVDGIVQKARRLSRP
jgi:hypothetical protein